MNQEPTDPLGPYRVDHLFVLVGENPLPAYVAARALLTANGTLYPVYSAHTKKMFDALRSTLAACEFGIIDKQQHRIVPVPLSAETRFPFGEYDSYQITQQVTAVVDGITRADPASTIGLNYTGGTGPMGIHSYSALRDHPLRKKHRSPAPVFSYLNPRALQMLIEQEAGRPKYCTVDLQVKLDDLIQLHGLKQQERDGAQDGLPVWADGATLMAAMTFTTLKNWNAWCEGAFLQCKQSVHGVPQWKSEVDLARITLPFTLTAAVPKSMKTFLRRQCGLQWESEEDLARIARPLIRATTVPSDIQPFLKEHCGATDEALPLDALVKSGRFPSIQVGCKWLEGGWLESYVLAQVNALASELPPELIHSQRQSIVIVRHNDKARFEFDVAFVIGYQLFAISCTTASKRSMCKSKLLEAYVRARQLGGGEARVALVCMLGDGSAKSQGSGDEADTGEVEADGAWELERELKLVLEDDRIAVFGRTHVKEGLRDELRAWVARNSGGRVSP